MTALEAVAGAAMVVAAVAGARKYRPRQDPPWKLVLICALATAGGWLTVGQLAAEAAHEAARIAEATRAPQP